MAEGDDQGWEWLNALYNDMNPETGVQFDPHSINYDMSDQAAGRKAYRGWGDPEYPWREQRPRAEYAQKLKMQQKLADELRSGLGAYLPGGGFATDENTK